MRGPEDCKVMSRLPLPALNEPTVIITVNNNYRSNHWLNSLRPFPAYQQSSRRSIMAAQKNIALPDQRIVMTKPHITAEIRQSKHLSKWDNIAVDFIAPFKCTGRSGIRVKWVLCQVQWHHQSWLRSQDWGMWIREPHASSLPDYPIHVVDHVFLHTEGSWFWIRAAYRHYQFEDNAPWGLWRISACARLNNRPLQMHVKRRRGRWGADTVAYVINALSRPTTIIWFWVAIRAI